jgi:hypothetical protein
MRGRVSLALVWLAFVACSCNGCPPLVVVFDDGSSDVQCTANRDGTVWRVTPDFTPGN